MKVLVGVSMEITESIVVVMINLWI